MPPLNEGKSDRFRWRSLDELAGTPGFRASVEKQFPTAAPRFSDSTTRRDFLSLMGASLALAGMTGCRWPRETIVPYARRPPGRTPGVPVHYATAMELAGVATGLLVASHDGRPIKIEGNELHPFSRGATDAIAQASVLELYDPDRSQRPVRREGDQRLSRTWQEFADFARSQLVRVQQRNGDGLCVLSEASLSPSLRDMRARLYRTFPQVRWYEFEPLSRDNERTGAAQVFGKPYRTHLALARADRIVCLDADPLMTHPAAVRYAWDFAQRRRGDDGTMNRLYVVESAHTVTGSMADHRYPVRAADVAMVASRLADALVEQGLVLPGAGPTLKSIVSGVRDHTFAAPYVAAIARDLLAHRGRCAVVAGPRQPAEVHALTHLINAALGNTGRTIAYTIEPDPERPSHLEAIGSLVEQMRAGRVDMLLVLGGNPAFNAPADLEFVRHLATVKTSIHLSLYDDETSRLCTWHVPRAHYLESWGDGRAYDGTVSLVQPLIEPLYDGKTPIEVLALLTGDALTSGYEIVRRTFKQQFAGAGDFETAWRKALHDGVVPNTHWPQQRPAVAAGRCGEALAGIARRWRDGSDGRVELVFSQDHSVYDGRFANNGWLQELPDPLTKLTWDNAALVSPSTARGLGLRNGDLVRLRHEGRTLQIPVYVVPGQARGSVTVPLGYGRRVAGRVGNRTGFDAYALRAGEAWHFAGGVEIIPTGSRYKLATTQDHRAIVSGVGQAETRSRLGTLVREATLTEYKADPGFAKRVVHHPPLVSLWQEHRYDGHGWGMAIDLAACTGCGTCVVACQAENNIPVVGKDEVERGREMHWIRIDRYFSGRPESPSVAHQPIPCQQCENAPCEQVCPVAATVHSKEGLNDQAYNRCIGTRYCANNCPYKVRRFNWYYNHKGLTEIQKMVFNPEVTVRSRGVMEKCTYCVQRINAAKIIAKNERRPIRDGEITPACAQACPTQAIVFGDLNDPRSRVRKLHEHDRSYAMLAELNVRPRTYYLAKLRNPTTQAAPPAGPPSSPRPAAGHSA